MTNQIEQNLKLSFSYVKKDLLKLNEQIELMNEKIQHLAMNHASLLGELANLQNQMVKAPKKAAAKKKAKTTKATKKAKKPTKKVVKKETITYE